MRRPAVVVLLLVPSLALAWGFDGHRRLASLMQDPLPANHCLKAWYSARQTSALQDRSCDPDRWRYTSSPDYDPNEAPRHYLEIDWVNPIDAYPRDWSTAVAQLRQNATRNGTVPWRVEDVYVQLVAAYRTRDPAQILDRAFVLSHYVADSFSMLHDTRNFDPNGLHARWESDMLSSTSNLNGVTTLAVTYYGAPGRADPRNNTFDIVIVGNPLAGDLIAADTAHVNDMPGFYLAVRDMTARRWGDALTVLSSLVWSAWAEAGSPELAGFTGTCSRAAPTAEILLRGFPVPGGFTHPQPPDGGIDAGAGGGSAGGGGGSVGGGGAGGSGGSGGGFFNPFDAGVTTPPPPGGCGCGHAGALAPFIGLLAFGLWPRPPALQTR